MIVPAGKGRSTDHRKSLHDAHCDVDTAGSQNRPNQPSNGLKDHLYLRQRNDNLALLNACSKAKECSDAATLEVAALSLWLYASSSVMPAMVDRCAYCQKTTAAAAEGTVE